MYSNGIKRLGLVILTCLGLSGCFIRIVLGLTYTDDLGTFIQFRFDDVSVALCRDRTPGGSYASIECEYSIELDGTNDRTSTAELLRTLGVFGLLIDPLILQVPDDLQVRNASYDSQFGSGNLDVVTSQAVPIDAAGSLTAEPGTKLMIFDLPPEIAQHITGTDPESGLSLDFDVLFERNLTPAIALAPFEIKALFTLPMDVGGIRYYIPMLPCVRSFADVPAIDIDPANDLRTLAGSLFNVVENSQGCTSEFYNFNSLGAQLVASHDQLDFGTVEVGRAQTQILTISAAGTAALTIDSAMFSGSADLEVLANDCDGISMMPGDSCAVTFRHRPQIAGPSTGMLTVRSNDAYQSEVIISLAATGSSLAAQPAAACQSLDLGPAGQAQVVLGRTAFQNTGLSNFTVASLELTGSADFQVTNDECTDQVLKPGFGCLVEVAFASGSDTAQVAQVTMTSDAGSAQTELTATAQNGLIHTSGFETRCFASPLTSSR